MEKTMTLNRNHLIAIAVFNIFAILVTVLLFTGIDVEVEPRLQWVEPESVVYFTD